MSQVFLPSPPKVVVRRWMEPESHAPTHDGPLELAHRRIRELEVALMSQRKEAEHARAAELQVAYEEGAMSRTAEIDTLRADIEARFAQALEESVAEERAGLLGALTALDATVREVRVHERHWSDSSRENIVAVALAAARRIVGEIVEQHPEVVGRAVDAALHVLGDRDHVEVRLHPDDVAIIEEIYSANGEIRWIPNERVSRGGCVVQAGDRLVDGSIEGAIAHLFRQVAEVS